MPATTDLHPTQIIKKPLITEKTTWEADSRNRISFEVDIRATKTQIKEAVASIYNVRVEKVSTQIRKGVMVRNKFGSTTLPNWKKATVSVHAEDNIELF